MILFTWNEKNNPDLPDNQVTHDCNVMGKLFNKKIAIGGVQEFGEKSDEKALRNAFVNWIIIHTFPIALLINPKYFKVQRFGYIKTHDARAGISPHRGFAWTRVKRKFRPHVKPFYVVNTHYVSGAFKEGVRDREWRLARWNEHHAKLVSFIASINVLGYDVYLIGDMNKRHYKASAFGPNAYTMGSHGLDHIIMCPAKKKKAKNLNSYTLKTHLFTDHSPVIAEFDLARN